MGMLLSVEKLFESILYKVEEDDDVVNNYLHIIPRPPNIPVPLTPPVYNYQDYFHIPIKDAGVEIINC